MIHNCETASQITQLCLLSLGGNPLPWEKRNKKRERESYTKAINLWTQGKQKRVCKNHTCGKNRLEDGSDPKKLHNMEHLFITCGQEHVQHRLCQLPCSQCSLRATTQDFSSRLCPHLCLSFLHGYLFFQNQRFCATTQDSPSRLFPHRHPFLFFSERIGTSSIWTLFFAKRCFCPQRRTIHR